MNKTRTGLIAALDIGSSKICCLLAHSANDGGIRVVGVGHHASKGVRGGAVIDMDAAQNATLKAVCAAEELAGEKIREVIVNISGGNVSSETYKYELPIPGREINEADMRRALAQGNGIQHDPDYEVLHCLPVGYSLDSTRGIRDPRGMFAETLGIEINIISARSTILRNLANCLGRCHLDIEIAVASPYASGLACLVEDEVDLGVTIVDMGGGTTTIAVFYDGEVIHADSIPVGGQLVTSDIARGLSTSVAHAERMKTLYGSTIPSPSDERELIDVPLIGEDPNNQPNHVPRSLLNSIIRPRIEETFELVRSRLEIAGMDRIAGRRLVLTGGASQLQGIRELATLVLEKQIRMGRPMKMNGLAEATSGPAFSTCAGLVRFAADRHSDIRDQLDTVPTGVTGRLSRLSNWLRENF